MFSPESNIIRLTRENKDQRLIQVLKKAVRLTLAFAITSSILLTGCVVAEPDVTEATTTTEETEATTTTEETEEWTGYSKNIVNHGHSIAETEKKRPYEIRRSSTLITNEEQAAEYMKNSIKFKTKGLKLVLTDTSKDDPGAFLWYQFSAYYNDIRIKNAEFYVITFIDGTICEGKSGIKNCSFANPKDVLSQEDALAKYAEATNDDKEYKFVEMCYVFTGAKKEKCKLQYTYRYDCGRISENCTIFLDAATGDFIGIMPDAIDIE